MRLPVPAVLLGSLLLAAPAAAAEPVMPLSEIRAGMRCTGYSVIRGTEVSGFNVEVLDVVVDPALEGPRVLVRASGPAVDATGIGPGFSGSPVHCPGADGAPHAAAAISEIVGDYGGDVVLATPMEAVVGTPPVAPATARPPGRRRQRVERSGAASRRERAERSRAGSRRLGRLPAGRIRPLAAPLTVSGLSAPLARRVAAAGRRAGRLVLAAPAGPLGSFPVQTLRPGSAMAVGYSQGDLALGAVGTVAYVEGDRVWSYGHPFDGAGARDLLLQDAYVFHVVGNPSAGFFEGTYKLASPGHSVGVLAHDGLSAVVGRTGGRPSMVPVRVAVRDGDTGARRTLAVEVADETDVEYPMGPVLPGIAPLAVMEAVTSTLRTLQPKLSGEMCARIDLRERRAPLRFCKRYANSEPGFDPATSALAELAAGDLSEALALPADYERDRLHVTRVRVALKIARGVRELVLRGLSLPRRVRPGRTVTARLRVQPIRGEERTLRVPWRVPRSLEPGRRAVVVREAEPAGGEEDFEDVLEELFAPLGGAGASRRLDSVGDVARAVRRLGGYDGVVVRVGSVTRRLYRDPEWLVTGRASTRVRVLRQSSSKR